MSAIFDVIVLGQGLAGTSLAWSLRWRGARVLVIDRDEPVTASKIAAGLITPITGKKLTRTWRHLELWHTAQSFYERIQKETQTQFFRRIAMVRLLADRSEAALFEYRVARREYEGCPLNLTPSMNPQWFAPSPGFEMTDAGKLDVLRYLEASRKSLLNEDAFRVSEVDVSRGIELSPHGVRIPHLGVSARKLVFCQGSDLTNNPWFCEVRMRPAKGEILTLRIPGVTEQRIFHRKVWLAPIGNQIFKAGATYDWTNLDSRPTLNGRDEILRQLEEFLKIPFELVNHEAAVRPIHRNQHPLLGLHPAYPQLGYFNGLGSKGSLQAPFFAQHLAEVLMKGAVVDSQVDLNRRTKWITQAGQSTSVPVVLKSSDTKASRPLTQQAQDAIRNVVQSGEAVIDATAGNGYDTQFLAELVGSRGTVFALDVQQVAIDNTSKRIEAAGLQNVILLRQDHASLGTTIPEQHRGHIAAAMFNLGYLPGGDKSIRTQIDSTREAITGAIKLLRPGGLMTILAYTGHDGGASEANAVEEILRNVLGNEFQLITRESQPGRTIGPRLFIVQHRTSV